MNKKTYAKISKYEVELLIFLFSTWLVNEFELNKSLQSDPWQKSYMCRARLELSFLHGGGGSYFIRRVKLSIVKINVSLVNISQSKLNYGQISTKTAKWWVNV
jgi:hypothetical protein